jgi:hypothetical protein
MNEPCRTHAYKDGKCQTCGDLEAFLCRLLPEHLLRIAAMVEDPKRPVHKTIIVESLEIAAAEIRKLEVEREAALSKAELKSALVQHWFDRGTYYREQSPVSAALAVENALRQIAEIANGILGAEQREPRKCKYHDFDCQEDPGFDCDACGEQPDEARLKKKGAES